MNEEADEIKLKNKGCLRANWNMSCPFSFMLQIMTQRPRTSTPALTKLTVKLDNGAFGANQSSSDVIKDIMVPEESVQFGVESESPIDNNHATAEPVSDDGSRSSAGRSDATMKPTDDSRYWTITPTTPTSRRGPSAYSQVKVLPTTITESTTQKMTTTTKKPTTVPSTTKATTTMTTTPASTTTPSTTTTTTTSALTTRTISTTTTLSTTSTVSLKSTSEMNDILGDADVDNNSERPLNDGLIPAPPGTDALSPVAPAIAQRPSIYQYGRPIDGKFNFGSISYNEVHKV